MLNSHPELAMPRETRFVLESWQRRSRFGDLRELDNRRRLAHWIFRRNGSRYRRLRLDPDEAVERLEAAPPTLGSMLATCFILYAEKDDKPRWGDKRPTYAARMAAIWRLFPNAHFINVVRDPRGCVASMRKLGWYEGQVAPAVELWERSLATVNEWRAQLSPDQLLEVKYEELVADPEPTLGRIAAWAGLPHDAGSVEQMLRYYEREERRSQRYHSNVSRPPDPTRATEWTKVLEPGEVAFVEQATRPLMEQYGYEPIANATDAPAGLRRQLRKRRRRQGLTERKLVLTDWIQKVTYPRPLALQLPAPRAVESPQAVRVADPARRAPVPANAEKPPVD
jgi:sulfotransferase family protein